MNNDAKNWLALYNAQYSHLQEAAGLAQRELTDALRSKPLNIHSIYARAKSPESVFAKVKQKGYENPGKEMTDVLGARVITSFSGDIDEVVTRLKSRFDVDELNSIDKRRVLDANQFGYRSVHLILLIKPADISPAAELLSRTKVEVQVRTIAEHAWAEAEHSLKYKSGVELPEELNRRLNALAAALEMIDREFDAFIAGILDLIVNYGERYREGKIGNEIFDSARFLAFMAFARPNAVQLGPKPLLLSLRRANECVEALASIGIVNAEQLAAALDTSKFRTVVREYADKNQVEPEEVSAAVCTSVVISLIQDEELSSYPSLDDAEVRRIAYSLKADEESEDSED